MQRNRRGKKSTTRDKPLPVTAVSAGSSANPAFPICSVTCTNAGNKRIAATCPTIPVKPAPASKSFAVFLQKKNRTET